ncbi:MAG: hypothetical protein MI757_19735 [Pirellulales bacterium]|nr:hypothetical protein [Pirellulales bacterium]
MTTPDSFDSPNISPDQSLLVEASWLLREGHRSLGVLAAVKACDVAIVRSIRASLSAAGRPQLFESLEETTGGFDLRRASVRRLY